MTTNNLNSVTCRNVAFNATAINSIFPTSANVALISCQDVRHEINDGVHQSELHLEF